MYKRIKLLVAFAAFIMALCHTASAQRSNYTEDDIIIMRSQEDVCRNIMMLLEEKNVDSALYYFHKKDKAIKKKLTDISTAIQQYKGKFTFEISPDAVSEQENHYYCKYTTDEGVTVKYRVDFAFGRFDKDYKVDRIVESKPKTPAPKTKNKNKNKK
ncbi:MAG: hypothetical protein ACO1PI_15900 [Bacteroidota bacterium]